jgi:predicted nuclease with TOPRIM domain
VDFIKQKIEMLKKKKEDDELERLMNLNNPDYMKNKVDKENMENMEMEKSSYEEKIKNCLDVISKLEHNIRDVTEKLNKSLANDGIWNALLPADKRKLFNKYRGRIEEHKPVDVEAIIKATGVNEIKNKG